MALFNTSKGADRVLMPFTLLPVPQVIDFGHPGNHWPKRTMLRTSALLIQIRLSKLLCIVKVIPAFTVPLLESCIVICCGETN